jgi:chaperonin GroES
MNLKPLHDWAVILPTKAAETTAGGLIIPDTAKEKPQEGVVEAIGPGAYEEEKERRKTGVKKERRFVPTTLKPGDRVIYERYAGRTYDISGEERILVRERDVLGTLERPLQIPAATTSLTPTTVSVRPVLPPVLEVQKAAGKKKPAKAAAKKSVKKKAVKAAPRKKAVKKPVKKAAVKKSAAGKSVAKTVKKTAKKTAAKASKPAKTKKKAAGKKRKK